MKRNQEILADMRSVIVFRNSEFISIKQMIPLLPLWYSLVLEFSILFYFHFKEVGQVTQLSTYFFFKYKIRLSLGVVA